MRSGTAVNQDDFVTALADAVLPLIRTRAEVWRWNVADAHGARMHEAVTTLREAAETENPTVVFAVTQKAIASALRVIMRADDSSGIIGDACRDLLDLHPRVAEVARPATAQLIDWMIKFQFENECDYKPAGRLALFHSAGSRPRSAIESPPRSTSRESRAV